MKLVTSWDPEKRCSSKFKKISKKNYVVEFNWRKVICLKRATVRNRCTFLRIFLSFHNIFIQRKIYSYLTCFVKRIFSINWPPVQHFAVVSNCELWSVDFKQPLSGREKCWKFKLLLSAQNIKIRINPIKANDFIV